jgi:RND family efflux transporter MFP subunit
MKNLIVLIFIGFFLVSCNSGNDETTIRNKIKEYQGQVKDLNKKIEELETQLSDNPGSNNTGNTTRVRVMQTNLQQFSHYFTATGSLEAINEAFISPEVSGQITSINVVEGQRVKKGQLLAKLNTSLIEKNIKEVETQLELAETLFAKQSELWNQGIGSERQYLESRNNYESLKNSLATLKEQYNMSLIYSPIEGYVEDIIQKKGELASPGMELMQIVDLDNLYVTAMLSEAYIPVVNTGEEVTVTFPTFSNLKMERPITRIGNVINQQNRTFKVEIKIPNPERKLKPNLLANITINDYNKDQAIVVPSMVIREDLVGSYLYIVEKNGSNYISKKKYVEVGRSYQDQTEVLSGISEEDMIITDGYSNVSDGMPIEIVG